MFLAIGFPTAHALVMLIRVKYCGDQEINLINHGFMANNQKLKVERIIKIGQEIEYVPKQIKELALFYVPLRIYINVA